MIACMETSSLLTNSQRSALSGPSYNSAVIIRQKLPLITAATAGPYYARKPVSYDVPASLQAFLPEKQQAELVSLLIMHIAALNSRLY